LVLQGRARTYHANSLPSRRPWRSPNGRSWPTRFESDPAHGLQGWGSLPNSVPRAYFREASHQAELKISVLENAELLRR
jgi:hypothetical protein